MNDIDDIAELMVKDEAAVLLPHLPHLSVAVVAVLLPTSCTPDDAASESKVQITLDAPQIWGDKRRNHMKKTEEDKMMEPFRREVTQNFRENYINGHHKVHLLLLLDHGQHINRLLNSQDLLGIALSIITNKEVYPPKRTNSSYLEKFMRWFTKKNSCGR